MATIVLLVVPLACVVWLGASLGPLLGTPVLDLEVGQCFNGGARPGATFETYVYAVDVVDCDMPHESELIATFDYPGDLTTDFPGLSELGIYAERECFARFAAYVGLPIDRSSLYLTSLYPLELGWRAGDRSIQCIVEPPIGQETFTGSVLNARR